MNGMVRWIGLVALALAALGLQEGEAPAPAAASYAITGVTVIDVETGKRLPGRTVLVQAGRIARVGPADEVLAPVGATVVDGSGRFLIPGLFDAHVHYIDPDSFGPLPIANGVTVVRDLGGATDTVIDRRDRLGRGEFLGPEMIVTGAIVDGDPPFWPFSVVCKTPEDGRKAVADLAAKGVDQIKVYTALNARPYRAILAAAKEAGLKVVGHVPWSVTLEDTIEAGQATNEHLDGWGRTFRDLAGKTRVAKSPRDMAVLWGGWTLYPEVAGPELDAVIEKVKASGMVISPTLAVHDRMARAGDEDLRTDPALAYVPAWMQEFWSGQGAGDTSTLREVFPHRLALLKRLHEAGVPLVTGTDLANPHLVAGFSLHDEMALFQEAGLPAAAVLRSATFEAARLCGVEATHGSVAEGKMASLVLLREDPLEDIGNARQIEAVFLRGELHGREALDAMLADLKARVAAAAPARAKDAVELKVPGQEIHRGRYRMSFAGVDAGLEDFVISRDEDGYHGMVHARPKGPGQVASVLTVHAGPDFAFRSAEWRQLSKTPLVARYEVADGALRASARRGDDPLEPRSIPVDGPTMIEGPSYALQFLVFGLLDLEPGERKVVPNIWFGVPTWEPMATEKTIVERRPDVVEEGETGTRRRRYVSVSKSSLGEMQSEMWTDEHGLLLRAQIGFAMGHLVVELEDR